VKFLIVLAFIFAPPLFCHVDKSVNVLTGAYQEFETDYKEMTDKPLTLERFYSSDPQGTQGWSFNHPRIITPKGDKPTTKSLPYQSIQYKYDKSSRLISLRKEAKKQELGKIEFLYDKNETLLQIVTSDGTHLTYTYQKGKKGELLLKEVTIDGLKKISYEYTNDATNKNTYLTKRTTSNEDFLLIDYDFTTGKVKSLTSPKGKTTFTYKGKTTEVKEPDGTLHIHTIKDQKLLSSTDTYNEKGELLKTVLYEWKEIQGKPYLTSKQTKDGRGKILITELKTYNALALITEDTLKGDLKGLGKEELYTKKYTYDASGLLKETDDGFVRTKLKYDTKLNISSQYTLEKTKIKERIFFIYNDLGFLTAIISDDGSKEDQNSLDGVTERWIKRFSRTKTGVLKTTQTFAVDLKTGSEHLLKNVEEKKEISSPSQESEDLKSYTYDCLGRITTITNEKGDVITVSHTSLGKPKTITYPDNTFENFTYETNGLVKTYENLLGHITTKTYDYKGRVIKEVKTVEGEVLSQKSFKYNAFHLIEDDKGKYTYTLFGELKTFLSKEGNLHEIEGNTIRTTFKNGDVITQTFNEDTGETVAESQGLIKKIKNKKPLEIQPAPKKEYLFGQQNRLEKTVDSKQNETTYSYDDWGRLSTVQKPNGVLLHYNYDKASRISRIQSSDQSIDYSYTYNKEGQPTLVKDLIGESKREYEKGQLISETFSNGLSVQFTYDQRGRKESLTLPDGSKIHYTYDPFYLRKISRISKEGTVLYTHTYDTFDEEGNLLKSSSIIKGIDPVLTQKISFDSKGNVITIEEEGETKTFSYNEFDELNERPQETFDNSSLEYDENGNLKQNEGWQLKYDAFERLASLQKNGIEIKYSYDFLGRRVQRKVFKEGALLKESLYIYNGQEEIGACDEKGVIEELKISGPQGAVALELDNEVYLPVIDSLGSIRKLVSFKTQEVVETCDYTPFGKRLSSFSSPWGFCGKREDEESHLIDFGKRDLSPEIGLFITKDPLHGIDGENPYTYCRNNPLTRKDLFGLYSFNQFVKDTSHFFSKSKLKLQQFKDEYAFENVYQEEIHSFLEATFGEAFFYLMGFHIDPGETGTFGKGECNDKVRITFINGILNDRPYFTATMTEFSRTHGYNNVHFVYRDTEGWTRDVINGVLTKMGMPTDHSRRLAALWREQIEEMGGVDGGGVIIHYAHSLGGAETVGALNMLTEEERKMIRVTTIGSPISIPDHLAQSAVNYGSCRDMVSIFNLLNHLHPVLPHKYNVVFIGSIFGIPMIDHFISMPTYSDLLDELGREFLESYSEIGD
jgi:RHS repeat-associated protein